MNKCKDCRWWHQWEDTPEYGACYYLAIVELNDKSIFPATKPMSQITRHDTTFNTGQNFGCVHHAKLETT